MSSPPLYDLVIFGTQLPEEGLDDAVRELGILLERTPDEAAALLRSPGTVIQRALTVEAARALQTRLTALGIQSNYRPSTHSDAELRIVGEDEEARSVTCPACGHAHQTPPGKSPPVVCERCGVVFRKFADVRLKKLEREQLRRRVQDKHQRKLELAEKARRERERSEQERRIEAQILREVGLSHFITTRPRLLGWALLVFAIGVATGVAGTLLFGAMGSR